MLDTYDNVVCCTRVCGVLALVQHAQRHLIGSVAVLVHQGALQLPRTQLQQFVFCGLQPLSAQFAVPTVMQHIQHTNACTNTKIVQTSASRCTAECSAVQQAHTPPRVYGTVCPSVSKHWHRSVASTGNSSKLSTPATANTTTRLRHSLSLSQKNPAATQCSHFRRQQQVVSNRLLVTALPPEHWLPCKYFQHIKIAR